MPNRLIQETSPYLLQHAHNPVDWYPWGPEALARASAEQRPIFLSIGYAACHWCHVMERESFEDQATARLMNERFISIKVDREERPDLDAIYMDAVVALTGRGGWPMSVFLTPAGAPFYGGTYFPPEARHGMPSFVEVLEAVANAWGERRERVVESAQGLRDVLAKQRQAAVGAPELSDSLLDEASRSLQEAFDWEHGGWGRAPKFPQPMAVEFLLRRWVLKREPEALAMAEKALESMAQGGMYDQLGGGFHRYSTDPFWLVPHFEKMLYDNALLARVYLHAWQVTGRAAHRRVVEETLDYVLREMTDPAGGFYSTQDADSEGEEGRFFLWSLREVQDALGGDASLFNEAYGVGAVGNFEGRNILHVAHTPEALAEKHGLPLEDVAFRLAQARQRLFGLREARVKPARDDKVLTAWNGLMLAAMAEAARVLKREDYRTAAERNAAFLLSELRTSDGRLRRSWRFGEAKLNAYLEDYSHLAEGLLTLYETTFDERWFLAARELTETAIRHFGDQRGGFFDTSDDHEDLIIRPKGLDDNAVPSGNAMAATVLLRLAELTAERRYRDLVEGAVALVRDEMTKYPTGYAQWLCALDFALSEPKAVAIVGEPELPETKQLMNIVFGSYRPHQVVALARAGVTSAVPLLDGRKQIDGHPTAYVCRDFVCLQPSSDPGVLAEQLF